MITNVMGEHWWRRKKNMLAFKVEEERTRDHKRQMKRLKELESKRLKRKKQSIGTYAWYFKKKVRDDYDERHPPPTLEDVIAEETIKEEEARKEAEEKLLAALKTKGGSSAPSSPTSVMSPTVIGTPDSTSVAAPLTPSQ